MDMELELKDNQLVLKSLRNFKGFNPLPYGYRLENGQLNYSQFYLNDELKEIEKGNINNINLIIGEHVNNNKNRELEETNDCKKIIDFNKNFILDIMSRKSK